MGQLFCCHKVFGVNRFDHQVGNQTHHQHAHQDEHGLVVNLFAGDAQTQLVVAHVIHHPGAQNTSSGPCGQQATVDSAHHLGSKQIGQISRYRGETAAIHAQDDAKRRHKQHLVAGHGTCWHRSVQSATQHKEDDVGELASQFVRQAGPHKTTPNVEQAKQGSKASCNTCNGGELCLVKVNKLGVNTHQAAAKHFLQHGTGHADHANAC